MASDTLHYNSLTSNTIKNTMFNLINSNFAVRDESNLTPPNNRDFSYAKQTPAKRSSLSTSAFLRSTPGGKYIKCYSLSHFYVIYYSLHISSNHKRIITKNSFTYLIMSTGSTPTSVITSMFQTTSSQNTGSSNLHLKDITNKKKKMVHMLLIL